MDEETVVKKMMNYAYNFRDPKMEAEFLESQVCVMQAKHSVSVSVSVPVSVSVSVGVGVGVARDLVMALSGACSCTCMTWYDY